MLKSWPIDSLHQFVVIMEMGVLSGKKHALKVFKITQAKLRSACKAGSCTFFVKVKPSYLYKNSFRCLITFHVLVPSSYVQ